MSGSAVSKTFNCHWVLPACCLAVVARGCGGGGVLSNRGVFGPVAESWNVLPLPCVVVVLFAMPEGPCDSHGGDKQRATVVFTLARCDLGGSIAGTVKYSSAREPRCCLVRHFIRGRNREPVDDGA